MKKVILFLMMVLTSSLVFSQSKVDSALGKLPDEVKSVANSLTSDTAKLTFARVYGDVKAGIIGLASALKVGAEHVYMVIVKQQVVNAITNLLIILVLFILCLRLWSIHSSAVKKYGNQWEDYASAVMPLVATIVLGVLAIIIFIIDSNDIVMGFVNPEYGAMKDILEFVK
jgi:membrane-associated protease RseP (regulator of RpoE activity)